MKSSNRELGNHGEDLACKFLEKNGYKIIERNKSFSKFCEIDIIAQIKNIASMSTANSMPQRKQNYWKV